MHRCHNTVFRRAADSPMRLRGRVAPHTASPGNRIHARLSKTAPTLQLFIELVESTTTRDEPFAEGTRPVPPPGDGWMIADFADEHATTWTRTRLIPAWVRT
jgi:hypothetical protein